MAIRGIVVASLVLVAAIGAVAVRSRAEAAAPPVRSATPTPPVVPTTTPTATPTPMTSMWISANIIVNAAPSYDRVTAVIGGVECASGMPISPWDTGMAIVDLVVPPAEERAGCGTPGSVVRFVSGGREARETVEWKPGYAYLSLIVGSDWATYQGNYTWAPNPDAQSFEVVAVVDGHECGRQGNPLLGSGPQWGYDIRVLPEELVPGCGRPGSVVHFELRSELRAGDALLARARETGIWQPMAVQGLDLTFVPVAALPATGGGPPTTGTPRQHVAFALPGPRAS